MGLEDEVQRAVETCFEQSSCCEYILKGLPVGDTCAFKWLTMAKVRAPQIGDPPPNSTPSGSTLLPSHSSQTHPHLIELQLTDQLDTILFKQIGDQTAANKKEWIKAQKKKGKKGGGKKGKKGK